MKNTTNILIIAVLAVLVISFLVGLGEKQPVFEVELINEPIDFGFGGYNDLGYSGMTQTTTDIGIIQINAANASNTAYRIVGDNSARMYLELWADGHQNEVRFYLGTTTQNVGQLYATSSDGDKPDIDIWSKGMTVPTTTETRYIIGPDNLWKGEIWALATGSTSTVKYREK